MIGRAPYLSAVIMSGVLMGSFAREALSPAAAIQTKSLRPLSYWRPLEGIQLTEYLLRPLLCRLPGG